MHIDLSQGHHLYVCFNPPLGLPADNVNGDNKSNT